MDTVNTPVLEPEKLKLMEKQRSIVDAVSTRDINILKNLLEQKGNPYQQSQINDGLMLAVKMKQTQMVEALINSGADVHAFDDRNSILLTAIDIQALDIFKLLTPKIKDVNVTRNSGGNMMHAAVKTGDIELVKQVYTLGVDINSLMESKEVIHGIIIKGDLTGGTPLHEAVKCAKFISKTDKSNYDFTVIEFLISNVTDVDARDGEGKTPLHEASIVGNKEVVQLLLDAGASPHSIDCSSSAPFMYALQHDHVELVDLLTADINLHTPVTDLSHTYDCELTVYYAHMASRSGNFKTLEYLMHKGVDMSVKDHNNLDYTPLMYAFGYLKKKCIFTLLKGDCGIAEVDMDGNTPLDKLLYSYNNIPDSDKILEMLLSKGANMNRIHPITGVTPLVTIMGYMYNREMTRTVLALGADINFVAKNGDNALLEACLHQYPETVNILMEHNISMTLSDKVMAAKDGESDDKIHNMTPLQISILQKNKETTDILLCAGCSLRNMHDWIEESEHCERLRKDDPYYQKVFSYIDSVLHGPSSLQDLSRISILQAVGTKNCAGKIDKLHLPEKIKHILPWSEYYAYRKNKLAFNVELYLICL